MQLHAIILLGIAFGSLSSWWEGVKDRSETFLENTMAGLKELTDGSRVYSAFGDLSWNDTSGSQFAIQAEDILEIPTTDDDFISESLIESSSVQIAEKRHVFIVHVGRGQ